MFFIKSLASHFAISARFFEPQRAQSFERPDGDLKSGASVADLMLIIGLKPDLNPVQEFWTQRACRTGPGKRQILWIGGSHHRHMYKRRDCQESGPG